MKPVILRLETPDKVVLYQVQIGRIAGKVEDAAVLKAILIEPASTPEMFLDPCQKVHGLTNIEHFLAATDEVNGRKLTGVKVEKSGNVREYGGRRRLTVFQLPAMLPRHDQPSCSGLFVKWSAGV